jgi:hypothetical protein
MRKEDEMKPFRKNVAIAIDGGGIRGVIPARALMVVEKELKRSSHDLFQLSVGTSTGSIIAAGIACGLSAEKLYQLYLDLGSGIFKRTLRSRLWFSMRYRYPRTRLEEALRKNLGEICMGDLWKQKPSRPLVITSFDLLQNRTRFLKSWKAEYEVWPVYKAVLASAAAPTYFPVIDGYLVDGGVGSYNNPCYIAAYESQFCLNWKPEETTLISLGTGRAPSGISHGDAARFFPMQWIAPLLDGFAHSADDQQVHLVDTLFPGLDFRRFQVDLKTPIELDKPGEIPVLSEYGEQMGHMILEDKVDRAQSVVPQRPHITARKPGKPRATKAKG